MDLTTNKEKFILNGHSNYVFGLKLINANILASGSEDNTIKLWNIQNGSVIRTLKGHNEWVYWSLDLLNNPKTLVSGSLDQTIKLWDWTTGECLNTIKTGSSIWSLAIIN